MPCQPLAPFLRPSLPLRKRQPWPKDSKGLLGWRSRICAVSKVSKVSSCTRAQPPFPANKTAFLPLRDGLSTSPFPLPASHSGLGPALPAWLLDAVTNHRAVHWMAGLGGQWMGRGREAKHCRMERRIRGARIRHRSCCAGT